MGTVGRCDMIRSGEIRNIEKIDVVEALHGHVHHFACRGPFRALRFPSFEIEIVVFPINRLYEYQWGVRLLLSNNLDEGNQAFANHFGIGIRESVENHGVGIGYIGKISREIVLQHAIAAACDTAKAESRLTFDLHGIAHARTARGYTMGKAGTENHDFMTKRILHRFERGFLVDTDLQRQQFAVIRQIEQTLLLG